MEYEIKKPRLKGKTMQWFKDLNAAPKLILGFGIMTLIVLGISMLAILNLSAGNARMSSLYQNDVTGIVLADNIVIDRISLGRQGRDSIINMSKPETAETDEKDILKTFADLHSTLDAMAKNDTSKEMIEMVSIMRNALPGYEASFHDMLVRVKARDFEGAKSFLNRANELGAPLFATLEHARQFEKEQAERKLEVNNRSYETSRMVLISCCIFALIMGLLLSIVISRGFSLPLSRTVAALDALASGDLTTSLDVATKDEVGRMAQALNVAIHKLRETLLAVSASARQADASSHELASAAESIASGSQEQAASLEETSASLEEITATVRQSADNAREANQLALSSKESAEKGQQVVASTVTAMTEINAASAKIADIISTVDEIAFQTNLLAVNAAVEAARAGDEGRGFAVVAAEVRSLAQRTASAAKEIKGLIQDSLHKVEQGSQLVNRSGETLQGILTSTKRVTDIVSEISAAANEQSVGIDQINTAVTQIDQMTQANSSQTEELSSTAQSLSQQAAQLLKLVGVFTLEKANTGGGIAKEFNQQEVAPAATKTRKGKVASVKIGYKPQGSGLFGTAPVMLATAGSGPNSFDEF